MNMVSVKMEEDENIRQQNMKRLEDKSEKISIFCLQNNKLKTKKFVLGEHIKIIEGNPTVYLCTICNHKFKWKRQGAYHEYCNSGERPLECQFCPKRFITNSHFQFHLLSHSGEQPYHCATCNKGYKQKDKLKRHEKIHKDVNSGRDSCPICKKTLSSANSLKVHLLVHSSDRPFKCKPCKKGYTNEYDLKRHMIRHTGIRNYVCELCGKSFPRKFNLSSHYLIHTGIRPFECSQCNCSFKKKYELTRHVKHHEKIVMYECNLCQTKFSRKDNLLRHARNTHPGEKVTIKLTRNTSSDDESRGSDVEDDPVPVRQTVIVTAPLLTIRQACQTRQPVIQKAPSFKT